PSDVDAAGAAERAAAHRVAAADGQGIALANLDGPAGEADRAEELCPVRERGGVGGEGDRAALCATEAARSGGGAAVELQRAARGLHRAVVLQRRVAPAAAAGAGLRSEAPTSDVSARGPL